MRISNNMVIAMSLLLGAVSVAAASPRRHTKLYAHASIKHASGRHHAMARTVAHHGSASAHHASAAVEMPSERATQIQTALVKQGYLTGEPSGTWDAQTVAAMQKMQSDNGWQSKVTPDSRALIKLGLGPGSAAPTAATTQSGLGQTNIATQTSPQ